MQSITSVSVSRAKPELALLLECARPRVDEAGADRIRALTADHLNWESLHALAVEHGVTPLLNLHLHAVARNSVPPDRLRQMHDLSRNNAFLNLSLAAELFRVLDIFRAADIQAAPYKGPVLAAQAYGDLALRVFSDLDLILLHRDAARACALLAEHGFQSEVSLAAVSAGRIPGQYLFTREGSRAILELHTERTLRYFPRRLNLEEMFRRLESVSVGGCEVLTFSAEDALSLLCVHGSKHFWERLMWIADIAALVGRPQGINWPLALAQARSLGATRMVHLGLLLAEDLLGAPLPESVRCQAETDRGAKALANRVRARTFAEDRGTSGIFERMSFRIRMRGGGVAGMVYLLRLATIPTEEDWRGQRLRGPLGLIQSVMRPVRLVRKYGLGRKRTGNLE